MNIYKVKLNEEKKKTTKNEAFIEIEETPIKAVNSSLPKLIVRNLSHIKKKSRKVGSSIAINLKSIVDGLDLKFEETENDGLRSTNKFFVTNDDMIQTLLESVKMPNQETYKRPITKVSEVVSHGNDYIKLNYLESCLKKNLTTIARSYKQIDVNQKFKKIEEVENAFEGEEIYDNYKVFKNKYNYRKLKAKLLPLNVGKRKGVDRMGKAIFEMRKSSKMINE